MEIGIGGPTLLISPSSFASDAPVPTFLPACAAATGAMPWRPDQAPRVQSGPGRPDPGTTPGTPYCLQICCAHLDDRNPAESVSSGCWGRTTRTAALLPLADRPRRPARQQ